MKDAMSDPSWPVTIRRTWSRLIPRRLRGPGCLQLGWDRKPVEIVGRSQQCRSESRLNLFGEEILGLISAARYSAFEKPEQPRDPRFGQGPIGDVLSRGRLLIILVFMSPGSSQ